MASFMQIMHEKGAYSPSSWRRLKSAILNLLHFLWIHLEQELHSIESQLSDMFLLHAAHGYLVLGGFGGIELWGGGGGRYIRDITLSSYCKRCRATAGPVGLPGI